MDITPRSCNWFCLWSGHNESLVVQGIVLSLDRNAVLGNVKGKRIWEGVSPSGAVINISRLGCPESKNVFCILGKALREVEGCFFYKTERGEPFSL